MVEYAGVVPVVLHFLVGFNQNLEWGERYEGVPLVEPVLDKFKLAVVVEVQLLRVQD